MNLASTVSAASLAADAAHTSEESYRWTVGHGAADVNDRSGSTSRPAAPRRDRLPAPPSGPRRGASVLRPPGRLPARVRLRGLTRRAGFGRVASRP